MACPCEHLQIVDGNEGGMGGRHGHSGQRLERRVRFERQNDAPDRIGFVSQIRLFCDRGMVEADFEQEITEETESSVPKAIIPEFSFWVCRGLFSVCFRFGF